MSESVEGDRVEELWGVLDELLVIWDGRPVQTSVGRGSRVTPARLAVVLAFASHTHRLARAVVHLHEAGMELEAMPLVRGVLEHGLTAQWMVNNEEALAGFVNEQQRQRRNTGQVMLRLGWGDTDEVAAIIAKSVMVPSTGDGPARVFQQLCEDFDPLGSELYAAYRVLSSLTHPGNHIVDSYLDLGSDDSNAITIRVAPHEPLATVTWLWTLCAGCMWASRAADMLDRNRPYRQPLRRIAKALRVPGTPDLHERTWLRRQGGTRKGKSS